MKIVETSQCGVSMCFIAVGWTAAASAGQDPLSLPGSCLPGCCRINSSLYYAGSHGIYWSSSLTTDKPGNAWDLYFDSDDYYMDYGNRGCGRSVRPVRSSGQN